MEIADEGGTVATTPTGYTTELSSNVSGTGSRSTAFTNSNAEFPLSTSPPESTSQSVNTVGISAYVVPPREPNVEVIDALTIVPEYKVIKERKKRKRIYLIGGIILIAVFVLVVVAIVVLTRNREAKIDESNSVFTPGQNPTNAPSYQAPSESPTASNFVEILSTIGSFYDENDQFAAIFSNESSPQYRAATWVADTASIAGVIGNTNRIINRFSLATLYFATNGDDWHKCGRESTYCDSSEEWLTATNECDWYAIECNDDDSSITKIFFPSNGGKSNNIRGTLPYEISFLSKLTVLIIPRGPVSGAFPDWSKLSNLEHVLMNNNRISGEFPQYLIRQNPMLKTVQFNNNNFQGHLLREELSIDSTSLLDLSLNGNNITGSIPSQISKLSLLTTFNLGDNGFTGIIPQELYTLTNLKSFNVSNTLLDGELSPYIGNFSQLLSFDAANTDIGGTLPISFFSLSNLRFVDFSFGKFNGSLPELFSELTNLDTAVLHNNGFTGTIPVGFVRLPFLEKLELHLNNLSGIVSEQLCGRRVEGSGKIQIITVDCEKVSCSCCTNCPEDR